MPEGEEGNPAGNQPSVGANPPQQDQPEKPVKTFTQEELDAIVQQRLARATPKDYDDLKAKAAKFDELEAGQKSELDKAIARAEKAEARVHEAEARANSTLKRAAILTEAANQNSTDPSVVVALLVNSEDIVITKEGEVEGAKEAVKKLLKDKAYLVKGASGASGGQFGGNDQVSLDDQIAAAEKKGDTYEAMRLKMAKAQGL